MQCEQPISKLDDLGGLFIICIGFVGRPISKLDDLGGLFLKHFSKGAIIIHPVVEI